jgi:hypothetical protein
MEQHPLIQFPFLLRASTSRTEQHPLIHPVPQAPVDVSDGAAPTPCLPCLGAAPTSGSYVCRSQPMPAANRVLTYFNPIIRTQQLYVQVIIMLCRKCPILWGRRHCGACRTRIRCTGTCILPLTVPQAVLIHHVLVNKTPPGGTHARW